MNKLNRKAFRSKEQITKIVTTNYIKLGDAVVGKTSLIDSYQEYAQLTGITFQNLHAIQKGERGVPFFAAVNGCAVFGADIHWMFYNVGQMWSDGDITRIVMQLQDRVNGLADTVTTLINGHPKQVRSVKSTTVKKAVKTGRK